MYKGLQSDPSKVTGNKMQKSCVPIEHYQTKTIQVQIESLTQAWHDEHANISRDFFNAI